MNQHTENMTVQENLAHQASRELRTYLCGMGLALLLTLLPFALVHWETPPRFSLLLVIGVCALAQILVYFRCFLFVSFRKKREAFLLIIFSHHINHYSGWHYLDKGELSN